MHHLTQEETDILTGIIKNMTEGEFLGKEEECEMFKRHLGEFCFIFSKGIELGKSQLQPPVTKLDEIIRKQDLEDLNNIESLRHSHTPRTFCEMVVQMAVNETITPSRAAELLTQPPVISAEALSVLQAIRRHGLIESEGYEELVAKLTNVINKLQK